jgi:hypothetical protein
MSNSKDPTNFEFGPGHPVTYSKVRRGKSRLVLGFVLLAATGGGLLYFYPEGWGKIPFIPRQQTESTVLYKWQDTQGNWQFTDRPPAAGIAYETLRLRHDVNVLPLSPAE